jgi:hypothetical protein
MQGLKPAERHRRLSMTGTVLERSLQTVIQRLQKLRLLRSQTLVWLVLLLPAIVVTLWLPRRVGYLGAEASVVLCTTLAGILLARLLVRNPSVTEAARLIEKADPELNDAVLTAVQVSSQYERKPSVLAAMAIQEADDLARNRDWSGTIPGSQLFKWTVLSSLSFLAMVSSVTAANRYGRDLMKPRPAAEVADDEKKPGAPVTELVIEPGDTELEQGTALTVVARFPGTVPARAVLEYVTAGKETRQLAMAETVDAGVFAVRMEEIRQDGTYRVLYERENSKSADPESSSDFKVTTFVRPKLDHVDAIVTPPAWSGRPQEMIEDVLRLTVTENSTVTLNVYLNKSVAVAELRPKDGLAIPLTPSADDPAMVTVTMPVSESGAWLVYLQDAQGRTPADDEQISIRVTKNEPAKVKPTFPGRDTSVSPLQEFVVEAKASDDFDIVDYGVQYSLSGGDTNDVSLKPQTGAAPETETAETETADSETPAVAVESTAVAADATADAKPAQLVVDMSHRLELESLNAEPDDLVTYSFWATDIAADGSERKTYSDLLFAEVRRFEEIFRESQQQGQQQQQQGQQQQQQGSKADGVLQLQKEILSATWNTIRTESASRRNGTFTEDVRTIVESQAQAAGQLEAVMEELQGEPKTTALAQRALEEMTKARQVLEDVRDGKEGAKLSAAMPIEQSVVQTLLKMRAAEFQVRQQQQQGGGGGGGGNSASQQQLQQLELDNNRNRYESEQQAQQQQEMTEQQRQQLQVLNRLKELARRQQMVNERLKQLESELRAATSDKEREEIERELKRLRDEQREMLRDVDELSERMEQSADQQNPRTSEMQQQMQEARNNVQQASRAMDEGRLSEAIAEGTRAERQFEELKEDFRNQTSSRFDDAVRDLRDQARELNDREEKLAQQLSGQSTDDQKSRKPSLRADRDPQQLQKDFGEQRDRLNRVVEQTKQIIEQAEQTEPLLSSKLYDAMRGLKDSKPEEALEATEFLAGRGLWSQSQQAEEAARKGIQELRDGIEQAADSVLGSEAESLRRAQTQLAEATEKLQSEVQSATGEGKPGEVAGQSAEQQATDGEPGESPADPSRSRRPGQRGQQEDAKAANGDSQSRPVQRGEKGNGPDQSSEESNESHPTIYSQGQDRRPGQRSGQQGQDPQQAGGQKGESQESEDQKSSESQSESQSGQQPGDQKGQQGEQGQKGQQGQSGQQPGQGQSGGGGNPSESESQNQQNSGESQDGTPQSGQQQGGERNAAGQERQGQQGRGGGGQRQRSSLLDGGRESNGGGGANNAAARPLTGEDFSEWSDQLRDIEEMLDDPDLRNRVAQVRDRARAMRAEFKRHGEMPQWDLVKSQLLGEMQSLQQRITQELARLESDRAMVPIDREPVPEEFDTLVQRYYELLGRERTEQTSEANPETGDDKKRPLRSR